MDVYFASINLLVLVHYVPTYKICLYVWDHDHLLNPQEFKYAFRSSSAPQFVKSNKSRWGVRMEYFQIFEIAL